MLALNWMRISCEINGCVWQTFISYERIKFIWFEALAEEPKKPNISKFFSFSWNKPAAKMFALNTKHFCYNIKESQVVLNLF